MTTATKRPYILHTDTGDLDIKDLIEELDGIVGPPEKLEGHPHDARVLTEQYIRAYFDTMSGQVLDDAERERERLIDNMRGFYDGYMSAKLGRLDR